MTRHYKESQYVADVLARLEAERKAAVLRDLTPDPLLARAARLRAIAHAVMRVTITAAAVGIVLALAHAL